MGKLLLLTLNEQEETAIDKIISSISNYMRLEPMQPTPVSVLSSPGLEIRQSGRRYFTVPLYFLLPIPALSSQEQKYLKPFGT